VDRRHKTQSQFPLDIPKIQLSLTTTPSDAEDPGKHSFTISLGSLSKMDHGIMNVLTQPAFFLLDVESPQTTVSVSSTSVCYRIPTKTGEYMEWTIELASGRWIAFGGHATNRNESGGIFSLSYAPTLLSSEELPGTEVSLSQFVLNNQAALEKMIFSKKAPTLEDWEKIRGVLALFSGYFRIPPLKTDDSEEFCIEMPETEAVKTNPMGEMFKTLALASNRIWAPRSWPSVVAHQVAALLAGNGENIGDTLKSISQPEAMGPIGHAIVAGLLAKTGHPGGQVFAKQGLSVCSATAAWMDLKCLTGNTDFAWQWLRSIEPIEDVSLLFPVAVRPQMTEKLVALRSARDEPSGRETLMRDVFFACWESGLKEEVWGFLDHLAGHPKPKDW
jgi:hypothetical protein